MDEKLRQKIARHKMANHAARIDPRKRKRTARANIPEKAKTQQEAYNRPERLIMKQLNITFEQLAKYWDGGKGKKGGRHNMWYTIGGLPLTDEQRRKFIDTVGYIMAQREKELEAKHGKQENTAKAAKTARK